MRAMEISRTGLDVEWRRMDVIADNLANMSTVLTATGEPFRARQVISGPKINFADSLDAHARQTALDGVAVYSIEPMNTPPRIVHEPTNPQADANGDVTYPGIDQAGQMTLLIKTSRAYEANIVAMNAARQMYSKALDLGSRA